MDDGLSIGQEIELDETICIICGGSTYEGETISCETCLRWFHFPCVGVTHDDDCVRMEDVPYYCPSCNPIIKKKKPKKMAADKAKTSRPTKPKPKPRKQTKPTKPPTKATKTTKTEKNVGESHSRRHSDGLKLKISLKSPPDKVPKQNKKKLILEDLHLPEPNLSEDSNSSVDLPLIIDEIAPRSVKVGRRRPSERQSGGEEQVKSEEQFGLEFHRENLQALLQANSSAGETVQIAQPLRSGAAAVDVVQSIQMDEELDEEERWLAAVQEGNIEKVHLEDSELRSVRDPKSLTARQRALMNDGTEAEDFYLGLDFGIKKKNETKADLAEKALKAQKRKEVQTEKKEKIKQKTMDTLLKKKDSKTAKQLKSSVKCQRDDAPKISYLINSSGFYLSYPDKSSFPLEKQAEVTPPSPVLCCLCENVKKYSCSKTGQPLCSLKCYKLNLIGRKAA